MLLPLFNNSRLNSDAIPPILINGGLTEISKQKQYRGYYQRSESQGQQTLRCLSQSIPVRWPGRLLCLFLFAQIATDSLNQELTIIVVRRLSGILRGRATSRGNQMSSSLGESDFKSHENGLKNAVLICFRANLPPELTNGGFSSLNLTPPSPPDLGVPRKILKSLYSSMRSNLQREATTNTMATKAVTAIGVTTSPVETACPRTMAGNDRVTPCGIPNANWPTTRLRASAVAICWERAGLGIIVGPLYNENQKAHFYFSYFVLPAGAQWRPCRGGDEGELAA